MKIPKYICAKCRLPFPRRWNANRHCNNKHSGRIENIISFTEYIVNQKHSSSIPLNCSSYEDKKNNHHYHSINVKNQIFLDNSISANNLQFNTLADPLNDAIEHELLPYKILDQLGPKYEEMQHILDSVPEPSRKILLGNALSSAINSNNPVETMNKKLIEYRKSKTSVMMLNDLAAFYNTDKEYIKEFLRLKAKQKGISSL